MESPSSVCAAQYNLQEIPAPTLNVLSNEILLVIVHYIPRADTKTLLSLYLSSKRLKAITEPSLYHTYRYTNRLKNPARNFTFNLIDRPSLAFHVKKIVLLNWQVLSGKLESAVGHPNLRSLLPAADAFDIPLDMKEQWKKALAEDLDDAKITLLLLLTSKVEDLHLAVPWYNCDRHSLWISMIFPALQTKELVPYHGLVMLRRLEITSGHEHDSFSLQPFVWLFRLPNLRTFLASRCLEMGDMSDLYSLQHNSAIDTIRFPESQLSMNAVMSLLCTCKAVREFYFSWQDLSFDPLNDDTSLSYKLLGDALRPHQNWLERLEIILPEEWAEELAQEGEEWEAISQVLSEFPNLEVYDIVFRNPASNEGTELQ